MARRLRRSRSAVPTTKKASPASTAPSTPRPRSKSPVGGGAITGGTGATPAARPKFHVLARDVYTFIFPSSSRSETQGSGSAMMVVPRQSGTSTPSRKTAITAPATGSTLKLRIIGSSGVAGGAEMVTWVPCVTQPNGISCVETACFVTTTVPPVGVVTEAMTGFETVGTAPTGSELTVSSSYASRMTGACAGGSCGCGASCCTWGPAPVTGVTTISSIKNVTGADSRVAGVEFVFAISLALVGTRRHARGIHPDFVD